MDSSRTPRGYLVLCLLVAAGCGNQAAESGSGAASVGASGGKSSVGSAGNNAVGGISGAGADSVGGTSSAAGSSSEGGGAGQADAGGQAGGGGAGDTPLLPAGAVAFWTFGEEAGQPRLSVGTPQPHPLVEVGGPITRSDVGPFSGHSAEFDGSHYLIIPHAELGDLDIAGAAAKLSMFAVVKIDDISRGVTIAGIWSEGQGANDDTGTRQYAMLLNMPTYGGSKQLTPHISSEGGVSRRADGTGLPWCADYAASKSTVPVGQWLTLGFTYDGTWIRAYFNGVMEERTVDPVKDGRADRYFAEEGPNGGHRGINPYFHGRGIFRYDPQLHAQSKPSGPADFIVGARYAVGSLLGEALKGTIGALGIFERALSDSEMKSLHDAANVTGLN